MMERPILFSAPMVRAILAGAKTQTRRQVDMKRTHFVGPGGPNGPYRDDPGCWGFEDGDGEWWLLERDTKRADLEHSIPCPHGAPGDRLWVRETWGPCAGGVVYRANEDAQCPDGGKWKPSIFMPRWASRITLEVVSVGVERVQSISDADIAAEGVTAEAVRALCPGHRGRNYATHTPRELWAIGWSAINGVESWDANPWVWVVEFKRLEGR